MDGVRPVVEGKRCLRGPDWTGEDTDIVRDVLPGTVTVSVKCLYMAHRRPGRIPIVLYPVYSTDRSVLVVSIHDSRSTTRNRTEYT